MRKIIICLIMLLLFTGSPTNAQPLPTKSIRINSIVRCQKTLHFKTVNENPYQEILYQRISKQQKDSIDRMNGYESSINIPVNLKTYFIVEKDTMCVNIIFDKYSPYRFEIEQLIFTKGSFIIDLKKCMDTLNIYSNPIKIKKNTLRLLELSEKRKK